MSTPPRRVAALALTIVSLTAAWSAPAQAATELMIVVTDADSWQRFAERTPATLGLGVFPDTRDALAFVEEIGTGAPTGRPGARAVVRGSRGALTRSLARAGIDLELTGEEGEQRAALAEAFRGRPSVDGAAVQLVASPGRVPAVEGPAIILGVGARTPVWVAICERAGCSGEARGIATGGIARRPAIVTPYDIAATILDILGVEQPDAFIGNPLRAERDADPLTRVRALRGHLERGAGLGATMGATTTVLAIVALLLGLLLIRSGRRRLATRTAQAAAVAVVGYVVALFVPAANGTIRALVIAAVIVACVAVTAGDPARTIPRLMLASAGVFALLIVVAPLRPGGLPGAAVWGNPLMSWRFVGVQNFEVSFIAAAVVVWGVLAGLRAWPLALVAMVGVVVVGAPRVGSNFVGVLTFAFGAALAVTALARRRVELWHLFSSAVVAAGAFVLALLADAGSPVSHGGRAARRISEGGFSTLVDFVEARLRLNLDLIRDFPGGFAFLAMMLAIVAMLMVWGAKPGVPPRGRVAAWAGAAMALSSLLLEDSGFYSGAVMLVAAAAAWMIATASGEDDVSSPASDPARASGG